MQRSNVAKTDWKKKHKDRDLLLIDLKTHFKPTMIKTM